MSSYEHMRKLFLKTSRCRAMLRRLVPYDKEDHFKEAIDLLREIEEDLACLCEPQDVNTPTAEDILEDERAKEVSY